jgi:hypothetical protein
VALFFGLQRPDAVAELTSEIESELWLTSRTDQEAGSLPSRRLATHRLAEQRPDKQFPLSRFGPGPPLLRSAGPLLPFRSFRVRAIVLALNEQFAAKPHPECFSSCKVNMQVQDGYREEALPWARQFDRQRMAIDESKTTLRVRSTST